MKYLLSLLTVTVLLLTPASAQTDPRSVVDDFYKSYVAAINEPGVWLRPLMEKHSTIVEPQLRDLLIRLSDGEPGGDEPFLEFDPFSNAQIRTESYQLGQTKMKGGLAYVAVNINYEGMPGPARFAANVVLRQTDGQWKIANIAYPAEYGVEEWNLLSSLKESFNIP